jgi:hypothetical protein
MQKSISIPYTLYETKEIISIPLLYTIETTSKSETQVCKVNLQDEQIPRWLTIKEFRIKTVFGDMVNVTCFSDIVGIKNVDTALFIHQVHDSIFIAEKSSSR